MGNADDRYLWHPRKTGSIYIRFQFKLPGDSQARTFVRSLGTRSYPEARRIRDRSFLPLISLLTSAQTAYDFADLVTQTAQVIVGRDLSSFLQRLDLKELMSSDSAVIDNVDGQVSTGTANGIKWGALTGKYLDHISGNGGNGRKRKADSTIVKYRGQIGILDDFFGRGTCVSEIDRKKVAEFLEFLEGQGKRADTTINKYMDRVGAIFKFGISRGVVAGNPSTGIRIEGAKHQAKLPFTREEADAVLNMKSPKSKMYPQHAFRDFGMIARYTGARIGEIASLRAEDVIEVEGVRCLRLLTEKTGSRGDRSAAEGEYRIVPIAEKLVGTIDECLKRHPTGLLFPKTGTWKWKRAHALGKAYNRAVKKIAPGKSFHSWRHYAISEMMNAGVPREIRLQIVGHKDDSVHGGYAHATVQAMLDAVGMIY